MSRKFIPKETIDKMVADYVKGMSSVEVGDKYGVGYSAVCYHVKKSGHKTRSNKDNSRKYHLNESYFETIDTEEKVYWLGFIYADGYISRRSERDSSLMVGVSLSSVDRNHLKKLNKSLDSTYNIRDYKVTGGYSKGAVYSRLIVTSDKLAKDLISHGVLMNKTDVLKPPKLSSKELERHFIRGYFDGDGSVSKSLGKKSMVWTVSWMGTEDVVEWIRDYLIHFKLVNSITKLDVRKKGQTVKALRYGGNIQVRRILDHFYNNSSIYLDRKYKRYKELIKQQSTMLVTA